MLQDLRAGKADQAACVVDVHCESSKSKLQTTSCLLWLVPYAAVVVECLQVALGSMGLVMQANV